MPAFPRTVQPNYVSALWLPTGLRQRSHSGKIQLRNTQQVGFIWKETWDLLNVKDVSDMGLMAFVRNAFNRQVILDTSLLLSPGSGLTRNGQGTPSGAITVDGAAQTGSNLDTTGWPDDQTNAVRAGDLISVENRLFEVSADASANGDGDCVIPVTPNVFDSPANGATVTISAVTARSMIWKLPAFPTNRAPSYYSMTLDFVEVIP